MQSDAKSFFCKKSHQHGRPELHFGGLWGHFGTLWAPNGAPEAIVREVEILMRKRQRKESEQKFPAGGGDPINLNGRKALRP